MPVRSKTAIKVHLPKLFNTKDSSTSFSQLFNFDGITSFETLKFSVTIIVTKLSNDYNAEQNDKISAMFTKLSNIRVKSQLECNDATPPSGQKHNYE